MPKELSRLKEDLKNVPTWVWYVGAGVTAVLFILKMRSGSSTSSTTAPDATSGTPAGTVSPAGTASLTTSDLQALLQYLQQNPTSSTTTTPTTTPTTPTNAFTNTGGAIINGTYKNQKILSLTDPSGNSFVSINGSAWQSMKNFLLMAPDFGLNFKPTTGTPIAYNGAGTYFGITVPAVTSAAQSQASIGVPMASSAGQLQAASAGMVDSAVSHTTVPKTNTANPYGNN